MPSTSILKGTGKFYNKISPLLVFFDVIHSFFQERLLSQVRTSVENDAIRCAANGGVTHWCILMLQFNQQFFTRWIVTDSSSAARLALFMHYVGARVWKHGLPQFCPCGCARMVRPCIGAMVSRPRLENEGCEMPLGRFLFLDVSHSSKCGEHLSFPLVGPYSRVQMGTRS